MFVAPRHGHVALAPRKRLDTGKEKSDIADWNGVFLVMLCKTFNDTIMSDTLEGRLYLCQEERVEKDSVLTCVGCSLPLLA